MFGIGVALALGQCGPSEPGSFPPGEPGEWVEAREPCKLSHDHDLSFIRVWADEGALGPYQDFQTPYPVGARLLKGLYRDERCEELIGYVTMEKLEAGAAPEAMDWRWRRFRANGEEVVDPRRIPYTCVDCHAWHCGEPPYGWDLTCSREGLEPPWDPPE